MKTRLALSVAIAASMVAAPAIAQSPRGEAARQAAWDEAGTAKYFFGGIALTFIVGMIIAILASEERDEAPSAPEVPVSP